jgi:hypothetical protein
MPNYKFSTKFRDKNGAITKDFLQLRHAAPTFQGSNKMVRLSDFCKWLPFLEVLVQKWKRPIQWLRGDQGCQMVSFKTKNPNLGKFWRALDLKMFTYFMAIWNSLQTFGDILWPFGIFCGNLVYFSPFWYFVPRKIWQPWRRFEISWVNLTTRTKHHFLLAQYLHGPKNEYLGKVIKWIKSHYKNAKKI